LLRRAQCHSMMIIGQIGAMHTGCKNTSWVLRVSYFGYAFWCTLAVYIGLFIVVVLIDINCADTTTSKT
jgi:hypothetical protein